MCRGKLCEKMKIIWNKFSPKKLWKIKLKLDDWINEGNFANFFLFSLPRQFSVCLSFRQEETWRKNAKKKSLCFMWKTYSTRTFSKASSPTYACHKVYISIKDRWILSRQSEKYICRHFKNLAWYRVIIYFGFKSFTLDFDPIPFPCLPHITATLAWLPHRSAHILLPSVRSELSK